MLPSQYVVNFLNNHYTTVLAVLECSLIALVFSIFSILIGFGIWFIKYRKDFH